MLSMYKIKNTKKKNKNKRKLVITLALILVIVGIVAGSIALAKSKSSTSTTPKAEQGSVADVSRPTSEEKNTANKQKQQNIERENLEKSDNTSSNGKKSVVPIITFLDQTKENLEAGALISGIYESEGTCTFKAVKGNTVVVKQTKALKNPTTTDCTPFNVPLNELVPKGAWNITISYSSENAQGTSLNKETDIK